MSEGVRERVRERVSVPCKPLPLDSGTPLLTVSDCGQQDEQVTSDGIHVANAGLVARSMAAKRDDSYSSQR